MSAGTSGARRPQRDVARRVLDDATRQRRARKALESLEQDNFHEDPHANLVMSKKALNLFQDKGSGGADDAGGSLAGEDSAARKARRRTRNTEYYKQRFRKNFAQLLEEEALQNPDSPNYLSAVAPPSEKPARLFCAVCGFTSRYACAVCGARYCSVTCLETHLETRCLKWTA